MSDSSNTMNNSFGKFVPGFDFLQGLATQAMKGAASGLPNIPQMPNPANWVAPTLNVEELDKRIEELKTVQFWLDQNAKALQATITALEVQKMTLATLKGMNFNMGDVANAFKLKATETVAGAVNTALGKPQTKKPAPKKAAPTPTPASGAAAKSGLIDPMQLWGSLTQQFGQIAADAMKDASKKTAMDTTKNMAKAMTQTAVNSAMSTAKSAVKSAATTAQNASKSIASRAMNTPANRSKASKKAPTKRK